MDVMMAKSIITPWAFSLTFTGLGFLFTSTWHFHTVETSTKPDGQGAYSRVEDLFYYSVLSPFLAFF